MQICSIKEYYEIFKLPRFDIVIVDMRILNIVEISWNIFDYSKKDTVTYFKISIFFLHLIFFIVRRKICVKESDINESFCV